MRTTFTILLLATLAACGSKQTPADTEVTEEVVATTEDVDTESPAEQDTAEAADETMLPPPADVAAAPPNAETSPSGLAWTVLSAGDGAGTPTLESTITVHYTGWTTDGKMFDSSVVRNEPIEFPLNKLILGWQEGIQLMLKGEKRRFWIPEDLAYGKSTRADAPKGLLVFDIELIDYR